ncbi:PRKR-interacting protein 1 [Penicillium rolfsii]|nr:PRKR-interacting protein 1 [Penicillium rolfsii]
MSEPGPESVPTSADPRSKRPTKRRAITPLSEQANQIETLFKDPTKEVRLPSASKERTSSSLAPPPEIVANVQGSSAGAGSGEFHVYKASRRREYERLKMMQSEVEKEKGDAEWIKQREEARRKDEEKTEKNRRRREKKRAARSGGKKEGGNGSGNGNGGMDVDGTSFKGPMPSNRDMEQIVDGGEGHPSVEVPGVIIHDED